MSDLAHAIAIAAKAHARQQDKAGDPYILHLLRVMEAVPEGEARIVAVLHDLLEDTDWTLDDLREEGFSVRVRAAITALTRVEGETYMQYIGRAAAVPLARCVKVADLHDHLRDPGLTHITGSLRGRYVKALEVLLKAGAA